MLPSATTARKFRNIRDGKRDGEVVGNIIFFHFSIQMHMNQTEMFMKPCVKKEDVVDPRHYVYLNTGLVGHWLPTPKTLFSAEQAEKHLSGPLLG